MANHSAIPSHDGKQERLNGTSIPTLPPSGPRKLVRPPLPEGVRGRSVFARKELPLLLHQQTRPAGRVHSSHAETFYLQKQMHSQTPMVFMLDDGERVEGVIEWYDSDVIKIRNGGTRMLLYKAAIKYLYKAAEQRV